LLGYIVSGLLLLGTAALFANGSLSASSLTACWAVVLFFASAGSSSAYLTVSEVFPLETRALAIAFFYAVGTGVGGVTGPLLFAGLNASGKLADTALAFGIGGLLMVVAGGIDVVFGVPAEGQSLEDVAQPLTAADSSG
jgi:MFS family permease